MDAALWWRKLIATAIARSLAVYAARDDISYAGRCNLVTLLTF
jgi:hypothetical protein